MARRISIILSAIALALMVCCVLVFLSEDRTAPELTIPEERIVYCEGQTDRVLLDDVTAWDNRDGDITSQVRVYSVAVKQNGREAVVTYAVYDEASNMTKGTRVVDYRK